MITGIAIVAAFSAGMWVMKNITLDYEDRIINAVKGREYSRRNAPLPQRRPVQQRPPQQQARHERPMLDEDDYDKLMREGRVVKRR